MKKIFLIIYIFLTINIYSASNNETFSSKLKKLKIELKKIINLSKKRERSKSIKAVTLGEKLIDKIKKIKKNKKKYLEIILYTRQVLAGIYLHRLKMALKAIEHYKIIIKSKFFKKFAPNIIKWLIYEGLGLAYSLKEDKVKALEKFLISKKYALKIFKKNPVKGRVCISSNAFNIAMIYAKQGKIELSVKFLQLAFKHTKTNNDKLYLKSMIKKEKAFKKLYNHAEFRKLMR